MVSRPPVIKTDHCGVVTAGKGGGGRGKGGGKGAWQGWREGASRVPSIPRGLHDAVPVMRRLHFASPT